MPQTTPDVATLPRHAPATSSSAAALLSAAAVRAHCEALMARAERGESAHFIWHPARLADTARFVASVIRTRYPDLRVPYHSRWRHFEAGGVDRWSELAWAEGLAPGTMADHHRLERARTRIDLVITSVLLDAGAGPDWRYADAASAQTLVRSEGLGVASLRLFASGAFSNQPEHPLRADGQALAAFTPERLAQAFQVGPGNPLVGVEGRAALIARLGQVALATPAVFGLPGDPGNIRLGHLLDTLFAQAPTGRIRAADVLAVLLRALGPMWPGRLERDGVALGDCWPHPDAPQGLVPFHKLTQWLTYSLLEPLEDAGLTVTGLDELTGLPEYRNGGLLLDMGLLEARDPAFFTTRWRVDAPEIVEWRALTVSALDRLAEGVRAELGVSAEAFPLARVLEGGTWAAGRQVAAEKRPGGTPPVQLDSDGTVF